MKALYVRAQKVEALIEKKQVALGMTVAEVIRSQGEPDQRQSAQDRAGLSETLDYVQYKRVPQVETYRDPFTNTLTQRTIYIKVETGRLSLVFTDGILSAINESEANVRGLKGKTISVPIDLF